MVAKPKLLHEGCFGVGAVADDRHARVPRRDDGQNFLDELRATAGGAKKFEMPTILRIGWR